MFDNPLGVRLMLWLGATVPQPAPYSLALAFSRAEVTSESGQTGDGFQITFSAGRDGVLDYLAVSHPLLQPKSRVILAVVFGAVPEVLIDGIITHGQFDPGTAPGLGTLTVSGRDLSVLMDLEERDDTHPNQADFTVVAKIINRYSQYGLMPSPSPTFDVPLMLERTPNQQATDLEYLRALAEQNGYVFYLEPVSIGVTLAYFGPRPQTGPLQPPLSVNLGVASNVKSIHFAGDALAAVGARGEVLEPRTRMTIPIPQLPSLRVPPLAAKPVTPLRTRRQREASQQGIGKAATQLLAAGMNAPDPYTAQGELDSVRYGHVLRARRPVGLRGAGWTHDGLWMVRSVTHAVSRQGYLQQFQLGRDGEGSLTPVLPG